MTKSNNTRMTQKNMISVAVSCFVIAVVCFIPSYAYISDNASMAMFSYDTEQKVKYAAYAIYFSYFLAGIGAIFLLAGLVRKD